METKKDNNKEEVYRAVLNAAIELEIQLGHSKWTYSLLSRRSKISRTLIYYYFGKSKMIILSEACRLFGEELAGIGEDRMTAWQKGDISYGIKKTRQMLKIYPFLIPFYFLYRTQNNEIGELIRRYEVEGHEKRKHFFPHLGDADLKSMYAFHLGLVTFPRLNDDDIDRAISITDKIYSTH